MSELKLPGVENDEKSKEIIRQLMKEDRERRRAIMAKEFINDNIIVGEQTEKYLELVYPSYLVNGDDIESLLDSESTLRLESMTFFRIASCSVDNVDNVFEKINEQFEKLFTALYSIDIPLAYGLVSNNGVTNLVLGIYKSNDVTTVKTITQGMLSGVELKKITPEFKIKSENDISHGILSGVPSLYVKEQQQEFSLSSIMRGLNGQNYTLLFIAKPVKRDIISQNISELITVRDKAFAVSKRNVARTSSFSGTETKTNSESDSKNSVAGQVGSGTGAGVGAVAGAVIGNAVPGVGTVLGAAVGGAVGGGLGTVIGNVIGKGKSHTDSYSESITNAITEGETVSGDIQNGFALELMNYADNAIDRLKGGQNDGIWQTAIVYSAETEISRNVIKACLSGELSKVDPEKLPMISFEPKKTCDDLLRIPKFLEQDVQNALCSYLNSAELGLLCTVPTDSVPDFEVRVEKKFPMLASHSEEEGIEVGKVIDGSRILENMSFSLSEKDLNKHTFVCGITGSGKTTTVKKILLEAKKPFLVIESAKKEYRNIAVDTDVYTLGKPEINAPKINPFYILPGVSPQIHIDYLKDLFNASFSFYGPMTYILEKCLHTVYQNRGWNLTLGYHPLLVNTNSTTDFYSIDYSKHQYSCLSHKYLFPTMQELKDEIARYIDEELKYDGEVAGNVKTAMKVRLENLCVGTKGYSFNTPDFIDFGEILENNSVFELEGLADDSDKAFSVGLLVIFINEYRQVKKEISGNQDYGLQHLLVIEEAHRLLKNVETERSVETSGNPKGKAVEHFTNMLAEMRSYGQGVIVAEQIPTKLAPDVIKNSSTKIVQRIVSVDDQQVIANTIGISEKDSIQLGSMKTGFAFRHKEGMSLPTLVGISNFYDDSQGVERCLDVFVSDEQLYNSNKDRFEQINYSIISAFFGGNKDIKIKVLGLINSIMIENNELCESSCNNIMKYLIKELKYNDIRLTLEKNTERLLSKYIAECVVSLMVRGVYCSKTLPSDDFIRLLERTVYSPTEDCICKLKDQFKMLFERDVARFAKINIAALIRKKMCEDTNIELTIEKYFIDVSSNTKKEIMEMLKGGWTD